MDLDELWIGDFLKIISSGEVGRFSGVKNKTMALLQLPDDSVIEVERNNVVLFEEQEKVEELVFEDNSTVDIEPAIEIYQGDSIDLHYDHLIQLFNHTQGHILDFQLEKCAGFIQQSIEGKKSFIRIIYGKGEGILKKSVEEIVKKYRGVISLTSANPDGASIDIWFK
ncbi:MAG: Smr/MutS family protein [Saprospiraceae bacterium]